MVERNPRVARLQSPALKKMFWQAFVQHIEIRHTASRSSFNVSLHLEPPIIILDAANIALATTFHVLFRLNVKQNGGE